MDVELAVAAALFTTGLGGCLGGSKPGTSGSAGASTAVFSCNAAAIPQQDSLRRLTATQYRNTLASLTAWSLSNASLGEAVMQELGDVLAKVPDDQREPVPQDLHGSYRRLDQTLQQEHVDGYYAVGVAVGAKLTDATRLATVVGTCAIDGNPSNDAKCLDDFVRRFGERALRRPLTDDEVTFYRSVYGIDTAANAEAYADVIGVMLNAPGFLYFVEHGDTPVAGQPGVLEVSTFELASRLSYQFWETMPDEELWQAASDGTLRQPEIYARQVERIYDDPRTKTTLSRFVSDWLKVEDLPPLNAHNQDPTFRTFAGPNLPSPALRQQMIDDATGMVGYYAFTKPASMRDLLTSDLSFNMGAELAKIYSVGAWDGVSAPPLFAGGQRPGLLTRALFLTSGSANTRPIRKGVFLRRRMLCDDIPPPPPGQNAVPPELRPNMTTREVVEELTEKPGTVCMGCHGAAINALGFATENFDALGRSRTAQQLFDAAGNEVGQRAVDTHSIPAVESGDVTASSGAGDLVRLILESGKAEACLARNYFRFSFARWEDVTTDGCTLEDLRVRLDDGGTLSTLLKEVALSPQFRRRAFK
jgi:hypothetical protein